MTELTDEQPRLPDPDTAPKEALTADPDPLMALRPSEDQPS